MKVSVIVPNYNHAKYLDERFRTIFNQTYPVDEVIILDDHSTDNSLEVIAKYSSDPRVKHVVVNDVNTGSPAKQWERGIKLASGDVVWIAESDDYCKLNMLEELVNAYEKKKGCVVSYSTPEIIDEEGNLIMEFPETPNKYFSSKQYLRRYLSLECAIPNASGAIFSRRAASGLAGKYLEMSSAHDYMFWAELASLGGVAVVNKNLNCFRRHSSTLTAVMDMNGMNFKNEMVVLDYIKTQVHISWLRNQMIRLQRIYRFSNLGGVDSSVKEKISNVWKTEGGDVLLYPVHRAMKYLKTHKSLYL